MDMPKVTKEYTQNKREMLLDAAQRVCNQKCIYDVTMRDIVVESGISQGSLYCYFKNIDEVFAALMNRFTEHSNLSEKVENLLSFTRPPEQNIHELCLFLADYMIDIINHYGRYIYELNFLYLHYPERFAQIKNQLKEQQIIVNFKNTLIVYLQEYIKKGTIQPIAPIEHLLIYWNAAFEGIFNTFNISSEYSSITRNELIQAEMRLLEHTILFQLNIAQKV